MLTSCTQQQQKTWKIGSQFLITVKRTVKRERGFRGHSHFLSRSGFSFYGFNLLCLSSKRQLFPAVVNGAQLSDAVPWPTIKKKNLNLPRIHCTTVWLKLVKN